MLAPVEYAALSYGIQRGEDDCLRAREDTMRMAILYNKTGP